MTSFSQAPAPAARPDRVDAWRWTSAFLALTVLPLVFDFSQAATVAAPKLSVMACAAALALLRPAPRQRLSGWLGAWFVVALGAAWALGTPAGWMWLSGIACALLWWSSAPGRNRWSGSLALSGWLLTSLYSWAQRLGHDRWEWSNPELSQDRTIAGLANPNYLSMYLAALLPLAWSRAHRPWQQGLVALGGSACLLTSTRGSLLALLVGLALTTLRRRKAPWLPFLLLFAGCYSYSAWGPKHRTSLADQLQEAGTQGAESGSIQARLRLWQAAARAGLASPWGVAPGGFGAFYLQHRSAEPPGLELLAARVPEDPHSEPLRIWAETGPVGFMCWLLWMVAVSRAMWRRGDALAACWAVLLCNGLTNSYPLAVWPLLIWWSDAALPSQREPRQRRPEFGWALVPALLWLALATCWSNRQFWWDDEWMAQAQAGMVSPEEAVARRCLLLSELGGWKTPFFELAELARRQAVAETDRARLSRPADSAALGRARFWAARRRSLERGSAAAWKTTAAVEEAAANWPAAAAAWSQAAQLNPKDPALHLLVTRALAEAGEPEAALRASQAALEINSISATLRREVHQLRAQIMIGQGRTWEGYCDWVHGWWPPDAGPSQV